MKTFKAQVHVLPGDKVYTLQGLEVVEYQCISIEVHKYNDGEKWIRYTFKDLTGNRRKELLQEEYETLNFSTDLNDLITKAQAKLDEQKALLDSLRPDPNSVP